MSSRRDDGGQFVVDLKKDEFEVFEDGVKQEIATFTLVHGGRVLNQLLPPPPPPQEGIPPPPRPPNDTAGRILLFSWTTSTSTSPTPRG